MKILLVKTSSLGDLIHTFPAITDAAKALQKLELDWVVEEGFHEVPHWHPEVDSVIPVSIRRWRQQPVTSVRNGEIEDFLEELKAKQYDMVLDAQGLIKSALVTRAARGYRVGYNWHSAREKIASWAYQQKIAVDKTQHAVQRSRQLFAQALNYTQPKSPPDYGLQKRTLDIPNQVKPVVFLHGTTWETKLWPFEYWRELAERLDEAGQPVTLPWGTQEEYQRAEMIGQSLERIQTLPAMGLSEMAAHLASAKAVVAVDTGLAHIAAAFSVPTVSVYGATDAKRTGTLGVHQIHLQSERACSPCLSRHCHQATDSGVQPPCFQQITPEQILQGLLELGVE
ncbi:MAG TPA: lipopolysaccharide heptosyltransferase I [Gammaproteobacteria bacterium]|nr:lipopolysaccharide heptosyltransferase I [Gammaproteobacteria bacterium]